MSSVATYVEALTLLGDESRLRLCALLRARELCVTDLVRITGISQSRVSTHLGKLRDAGIVHDRRDGQQTFYVLSPAALPSALKAVVDEATGAADALLQADRERMAELDAERRKRSPESAADSLERDYSPGRSWQSLALGLAGLLELGDVLDVGSGDGAAASVIAPYCRSLTCVDLDHRAIAQARARLQKFGAARASAADAHGLPFDDRSFDVVLLFHTLTYTERPSAVVSECARVLRRGGKLVVLCLDEHPRLELTVAYGERHPGFSPRALRKLLEAAGLGVMCAELACRDAKRPHLRVVLAVARKPAQGAPRAGTRRAA
jgi:ArsR family transcriptional regulator